jgi:capsular polysaccharide biosynthesis protein
VTILGAARRHWILVLVPILVFVAAAGFVGLAREATYTATTRMTIGRLDVSSPGAIAGFSTATSALASAYSRAIHAEAVVGPTARRLGLPPGLVDARIAATPLPNSPVFKLEARGQSPRAAVNLANVTARQLIIYLGDLNRSNPDGDRLFKRFRDAAVEVERSATARAALRRADHNVQSSASRSAAAQGEADYQAAVLRRETLRSVYQNSQQSQATTQLVQVLSRATRAVSDRSSRLQLLLFLGAAAGLLFGLTLAMLRASRLMARAIRG